MYAEFVYRDCVCMNGFEEIDGECVFIVTTPTTTTTTTTTTEVVCNEISKKKFQKISQNFKKISKKKSFQVCPTGWIRNAFNVCIQCFGAYELTTSGGSCQQSWKRYCII